LTEQTPWAERTVDLSQQEPGFRRGVASVTPRPVGEPPTDPVVPYEPVGPTGGRPRLPLSYHLRQLRRGSGWTMIGALFAFVGWGIWAISAPGDLTGPVLTFILSLCVAVGLFALCRLLGLAVLERLLGRVRRGALASHLVTGIFLVGVGVAYLRQTEWVMSVWNWLADLW
jgi:hypothetical protein